MSRMHSHFNTAKTIIASYKGEMPLSAYLKDFFSKEKKYGSKDRKSISTLTYNYYRLGFALNDKSIEDILLTSMFLFTNTASDLLNDHSVWKENITLPLTEKINLINLNTASIFPFNNELSEGIDVLAFNTSFLIQPEVFIRIRPGQQAAVKDKLIRAEIQFKEINQDCFSFENGTKLDSVLSLNKEAVIQDLNSQRVGELLVETKSAKLLVWDCCAASGGKSIMAFDLLPNIDLTVSDIRQSIIHNLSQRFSEAGIKKYKLFRC